MKYSHHLTFAALCLQWLTINYLIPVQAQIIPDNTLGNENSQILQTNLSNQSTEIINGGANRGKSLFHSFTEFNIRQGNAAYFNPNSNISVIFSRITGNKPSQLNGTLGVRGTANLFFMNPNGIIFGPNARLDLAGSFVATTAEEFILGDKASFSSRNPKPVPPLLLIQEPIGLKFRNPGSIVVQGSGHNYIDLGIPYSPIVGSYSIGLDVKSGKTLALLGGDISLEGGVLNAPDGRILLSAIRNGEILVEGSLGLQIRNQAIASYANINMKYQSLINTSGFGDSEILIQGNDISSTDNSLVLNQNLGLSDAGSITVHAEGQLQFIGDTGYSPILTNYARVNGGIETEAFGDKKGADVHINAKALIVKDSARVLSRSLGSGQAGNIDVTTADGVSILGASSLTPLYPLGSIIGSVGYGSGQAGDVFLKASSLNIRNGGQLQSSSYVGNSGNVDVNAKQISIDGYNSFSLTPSLISTTTLGKGNAGKVLIKANQLSLTNGGRVDSSSLASGDAGNININASQFIHVQGSIPNSLNPTLISSAANEVDTLIQQGLGLPELPTGNGGNILINTPELLVSDGAQITVRADGTGNAGELTIKANNISLQTEGGITASTSGGDGGNLNLITNNLLFLDQGQVSAAASRQGQGGNIAIDAGLLVLKDKSSISANADQNAGGNVTIKTRGLFADKTSTITATSNLGPQFDGIVQIDTSNIDFTRASIPEVLPQTPTLLALCQREAGGGSSTLVVGALGGYPIPVEMPLGNEPSWNSSIQAATNALVPNPRNNIAVTWKENPDGTISFVGAKEHVVTTQSILCRTVRK